MQWEQEISLLRALDCHSHHLEDASFQQITLGNLLRRSYLNWSGSVLRETEESRRQWLARVRTKNTWRLLERSLRTLYGWPEITPENWEECSRELEKFYEENPEWQRTILKEYCRYDRVLLDAYWDSGSDLGHPELFASVFRLDPFFFGYAPGKNDHDGNNPLACYGIQADSLESYLRQTGELIEKKVRGGCVALKNAIAYDRSVQYDTVSREQASRVFETADPSPEEEKAFQDYFFDWACGLAADLQVPIQCHTGMGCLEETRAIRMAGIIRRHPSTKFSIMHGSFPWTSDLLALLTSFENVWSDICWLPLLSSTLSIQFLHQLIEAANCDRVIWGCDTWTSEDSLAARLGVNEVLAAVLREKTEAGYFSVSSAMEYAGRVLKENGRELFSL